MRCAIELSDIHDVVFVFQDCSFVVIHIEVVGRAEDRHNAWKACRAGLAIHSVPSILGFVGTDDGEKIVLLEECAGGRVREEVRTPSDVIMDKVFACLLLAELFKRVCPKDVAHETVCRRLTETVDLASQY